MGTKKRIQAQPGWWQGFRVQEVFLLAAALLPLVYMPWVLDLYDLPKRSCLNLLAFAALGWHAFESLRLGAPMTLAGGPLALPAALYGATMVLSGIGAFNSQDALDGILQQATPALLVGVLLAQGLSRHAAERYITMEIVAASIATLIGLLQFMGWDTEHLGIRQVIKPASLFGNKNMAAEYILMILPLFLYRCETSGFHPISLVATSVVLAFLFVGYTKAVWIGSAIVLAITGWRVFRSSELRAQLVLRAPFLAGAVVTFLILVNANHFANREGVGGLRALEVAAKGTGYSAGVRFALWENCIPMLAETPVLGVGPANWYIHYPKFAFARRFDPTFSTVSQAEHPHNDVIQVFTETGTLGGLAFLWIFVVVALVAKAAIGVEKPDAAARNFYLALSIVAVLLDGVFAYPMHLAPGAAQFWIVSALLVAGLSGARPLPLPGGVGTAAVVLLAVIPLSVREVLILKANGRYRDAAVELASNRNEAGEKLLRESIDLDRHRYRTHSVMGRTLAQLGRPSEAIAEYELALQCHPNQINVLYNLAHTLWGTGQRDAALAMLDRALAVVPRFQEGLYLKATYLKELGKKAEALEVFRNMTQVVPTFADAHNELGNLLKEARRYTDAEAAYRQALVVRPEYGEVQNNLGVVYMEQGRNAEAAACFQKAIEQAPKYAGSYFNLGRTLSLLGRNAEALESYRTFVSKWEGDPATKEMAQREALRLEAALAAGTRQPVAVPVTVVSPAPVTPSK